VNAAAAAAGEEFAPSRPGTKAYEQGLYADKYADARGAVRLALYGRSRFPPLSSLTPPQRGGVGDRVVEETKQLLDDAVKAGASSAVLERLRKDMAAAEDKAVDISALKSVRPACSISRPLTAHPRPSPHVALQDGGGVRLHPANTSAGA